jgi:hypothetical protein
MRYSVRLSPRLRGSARLLSLLAVLSGIPACAQSNWFDRYEARLKATQAEQPHWATPLVTTNPRVEEDIRADFVRESLAGGQQSWNYGNSKGLQIVPFRRIELRFSPPPFIAHSDPKVEDGFGDATFRAKVRVYGSSEEHRNAIVTALLGASVPTGKSGNGSCCAILTPTLEAGKGLGKFDAVTSLGGSLPVTNATGLGRQIVWNNAAQVHATHLLWLETEINSTFYRGGKNDGRSQTFVTPGVIVSRMPMTRSGNLTLTLGAGEQIALTHFNTYNHSPIFSVRLRF